MRQGPAAAQSTPPDPENARLMARLETMPVIEQAKGIVMPRAGCGQTDAPSWSTSPTTQRRAGTTVGTSQVRASRGSRG
jgi:hypothetical protein